MMLPTHLNISTGWVCNDVEVFLILGALAKLRKATITFLSICLYVRPSAGNDSVPNGRIFMKFDIWVFFENLPRKFKFS
jgi:hypothetical protein